MKELGNRNRVPILKARETLTYILPSGIIILEWDFNILLQLNACFLNETLLHKSGSVRLLNQTLFGVGGVCYLFQD